MFANPFENIDAVPRSFNNILAVRLHRPANPHYGALLLNRAPMCASLIKPDTAAYRPERGWSFSSLHSALISSFGAGERRDPAPANAGGSQAAAMLSLSTGRKHAFMVISGVDIRCQSVL